MQIGLIGGIGPAATVAYYTRLVRTFAEAGLPLALTIVHADMGTLVANAAEDRREQQAEIFARHIGQLAGAGCDVATITALTGHFCFAETERRASLPLVNAIRLINQYCEKQNIRVLGLLGGTSVLATHLFGMLKHPQTVIPAAGARAIGDAYMQMAKSGVCTEEQREQFFAAGSEMTRQQHADAVLLAGTDLGLAFEGHDPDFPVIDALDVHVQGLVALARKGLG